MPCMKAILPLDSIHWYHLLHQTTNVIFKPKKKEMKLTAAQRDWDTLYQLVVSFIRLPLA